jgi:hypothetical protein
MNRSLWQKIFITSVQLCNKLLATNIQQQPSKPGRANAQIKILACLTTTPNERAWVSKQKSRRAKKEISSRVAVAQYIITLLTV